MIRRALEPVDYPFFDYRRFTFSLAVAVAGQVWLSGSTAVRFDAGKRSMIVEGDLIAQAGVIHDKMRKTLAADSMGLVRVTRMTQYVTPVAVPHLASLHALTRTAFAGAAPIVSTVVVERLLRDAALIEIEGVASTGAPHPPCIVVSAHGDPADGDIVGQCRQAYSTLRGLLDQAGATLESVVKTTEFITADALAGYRETAHIRRELFAQPFPAATGVVVDRLSRLGSQILVEAIAVRGG